MAQWCDVTADIKPGEHTVIELEEFSVLLVNIDGRFYAVENICPHDGGELDGGTFDCGTSNNKTIDNDTIENNCSDNATVTCPRHGACFSLKTGKVLKPPAFEDIGSFAVRIHDGQLQIYDEPTGQETSDPS
ncbi:MAG: Rieske 2Fe-2S domain-containing protein [Amphritea sp.]